MPSTHNTRGTKRKQVSDPTEGFLNGLGRFEPPQTSPQTPIEVDNIASWNPGNNEMMIALLEAAVIFPCVGGWEPSDDPNKAKVASNIAPSKLKAVNMASMINECLEYMSASLPQGFTISARSAMKAIPTALALYDARLAESQTKSGNGDADDSTELDSVLQSLMETIAEHTIASKLSKDERDKATRETAEMNALASAVRNEGVAGLNAEFRTPGRRASPTVRASRADAADAAASDVDSEGSEDLDPGQLRGAATRASDRRKSDSAVMALVDVLKTSANTDKEDKAAQRAFDSQRLGNDTSRVDIEKTREERLGREYEDRRARDERLDAAKIARDEANSRRLDQSQAQNFALFRAMMDAMKK